MDLYPFLNDEKTVDMEGLRQSVAKKAADSQAVQAKFFADYTDKILHMAQTIAASYRAGGQLFTMGNGGSACDAAHVATEFMHPVTTGRKALAATNLCADISTLTAVGNDVNMDSVFLRQLLCLGKKDDVLIGFSTSGNSDNLLRGFATAKEIGMATIGFAGQSGGAMAQSSDVDVCLVVETDSIHRVQESHLVTYHILWDLVHSLL